MHSIRGVSTFTLRSRISRWKENDDGTSAIEFALLAPLFILFLLGMVAYGIYFGASHSVQQIAADAARTASINRSSPPSWPTTRQAIRLSMPPSSPWWPGTARLTAASLWFPSPMMRATCRSGTSCPDCRCRARTSRASPPSASGASDERSIQLAQSDRTLPA